MPRALTALFLAVVLSASSVGAAPQTRRRPSVSARPAATVRVSATEPVQSAYRKSPYVGAVTACEEIRAVRGSDGVLRQQKVWKTSFADGADRPAYPASVTKLMTLLLVIEDVRAGRYGFGDLVTATPDVYRCEPSWVGIKPGETMSVRDLLLALMVESANDAAIALAIHSARDFDAFVARMNARAAELGMSATRYYNPNGLPPNAGRRYPWKSFNVTTANDQLKLALRLVSMSETFAFTAVKTCDLVRQPGGYRVSVTRKANEPFRQTTLLEGEKIVKQMLNHNNIMVKDKLKVLNPGGVEAVDGLKTGYIHAGGSSVVLTGLYGSRRAVVVVLGSASAPERDENARRLMTDALGSLAW